MRLLLLIFLLTSCVNEEAQQVSEGVQATTIKAAETAEPPAPVFEFNLNYVMGKFDPAKHRDFTSIPTKYADQAGRFMRKDALEAFIEMFEAAQADGINLTIKSATRNFDYQKGIWERKWTGERLVGGKDLSKSIPDPVERAKKILEYSSMPGTSRHHWGTDIDLNDFENSYFEKDGGLEVYQWLTSNAATFGFCQVYTQKGPERPDGYNMEKWHWSYIPVAKELTAFAERQLKDNLLSGFMGAEAAVEIGVVQKYVLGINPACK